MPTPLDNSGWTPDIARAMTDAMHDLYRVQREMVELLRDLRDELAMAREDRRQRGDRRDVARAG